MNRFQSLQSAAASLIALLFTASSEKNLDAEQLFAQGQKLFIDAAVEQSGFEKAVAIYAVGRYLEVALLTEGAMPEAQQTPAFQALLDAAQWRIADLSDTARGTSAPGFLFFGRTARRDDLDAVLAVQGFMQERSTETIEELRALRQQVADLSYMLAERHATVDARNAARRRVTVG